MEGWETFEGHTPHRPYIDAVKIRHPTNRVGGGAHQGCGQPVARCGHRGHQHAARLQRPRVLGEVVSRRLDQRELPGQFRNWFYSLLAQSTVLTGRGPFKNLFSYATLLAEDGRAMHKSWGNSIEFNQAADQMGADTMRWLYASCKPRKICALALPWETRPGGGSSSRCGMCTASSPPMPVWMAGNRAQATADQPRRGQRPNG